MEANELKQLVKILNPDNIPGKLVRTTASSLPFFGCSRTI